MLHVFESRDNTMTIQTKISSLNLHTNGTHKRLILWKLKKKRASPGLHFKIHPDKIMIKQQKKVCNDAVSVKFHSNAIHTFISQWLYLQ